MLNPAHRVIPSQFGGEVMVARFRAKIGNRHPETGCLEWLGCCQSNGYGQVRINKVVYYAHHISWRLENGDIPTGMHVLHKCDNPRCVNPNHLFLGNHRDNMHDMMRKGRHKDGPNSPGVTGKNPFIPQPSVFLPMTYEEKRAKWTEYNRQRALKRKREKDAQP